MTREEIAERFPQAVEFARLMRDTFGDGVRLTYARNDDGEIGRPAIPTPLGAALPVKV